MLESIVRHLSSRMFSTGLTPTSCSSLAPRLQLILIFPLRVNHWFSLHTKLPASSTMFSGSFSAGRLIYNAHIADIRNGIRINNISKSIKKGKGEKNAPFLGRKKCLYYKTFGDPPTPTPSPNPPGPQLIFRPFSPRTT